MAISVFPAGGGEFVTNDFVVDMNNTDNNVIDLGRSYAAGSYEISLASGDSTFDIYALDSDGSLVGYTNNATLIASAAYTQLVILGVATDEKITFAFAGNVSNPSTEGNAVGAGAYLEGISPFDLPNVDDTATVTGGNFATDVEIYFESGTLSTVAKTVTRNDATELIVTRPDALDPALDPWDVKAINPGITPPTGSNAHILAGTVDAGAVPVWQTTSPLPSGTINTAYAATVVATDADGAVTYGITAGSLPGLTLNGATGVISGTPTASGSAVIEALDDGGNSNERTFILPWVAATGGSISTVDEYTVHTFNTSDDFVALGDITGAEYIVVGGGGGGGGTDSDFGKVGAGGGGGGLLSSVSGFASGEATSALSSVNFSAGTTVVTIGAGGAGGRNFSGSGSDTTLGTLGTAIGGGGGAHRNDSNGKSGGSGGGGQSDGSPGSGTTGQGFAGGNTDGNTNGAGGGGTSGTATAGDFPISGDGGNGTSNFLDQRGWGAGGGGGRGNSNVTSGSGGGSDGNDQTTYAGDGGSASDGFDATANFGGGGGGGGGNNNQSGFDGGDGGSGKVVIRY